jgi:small conductance mechanosensitive channel
MLDFLVSVADWFRSVWNDWHVLIRIVLIVFVALIARWVLLTAVKRVVNSLISGIKAKKAPRRQLDLSSPINQERVVQRTRTMGTVMRNMITWSIGVISVSAILSELGISMSALAAGAGILGAGLGFGAQSLIKDLISGLFIVFEDQYGVGDTVNLGDITGVVESVGLRVTQVRDFDGVLWYVRNGEVVRVGNQTQGWSRAMLDIALPYGADVTGAQALLLEVAKKVALELSDIVIDEPEAWGIQVLNGNQIVVRVVQRTKSGKSDEVGRALRLAAKIALDKADIKLATDNTVINVNTSN